MKFQYANFIVLNSYDKKLLGNQAFNLAFAFH